MKKSFVRNCIIAALCLIPIQAYAIPFYLKASYPAGTNPAAIIAADINGDSYADLAVANSGSSNVTVRLGNGTGAFPSAWTNAPVGTSPVAMASGDFNGDARQDLVTLNYGSLSVSVLITNPPSGFTRTDYVLPAGQAPQDIEVADFNGDNNPDVIVTDVVNKLLGTVDGVVKVMLGDGAGGFAPFATYPTGKSYPTKIAKFDFNGDPYTDVAIIRDSYTSIMPATSTGAFTNPSIDLPVFMGRALVSFDFNHDPYQDLAVSRLVGLDSYVSVFPNNGDGTFAPAIDIWTDGQNNQKHSLAAADFDLDGNMDIAVSLYASTYYGAGYILLNNGDGTFTRKYVFGPAIDFAVGDFNVDSYADLALAVTTGIKVYISDNTPPAGAFTINNGAAYTKFQNVMLYPSCTDSSGCNVSFSNTGLPGSWGATYGLPRFSVNWTLPAGDGLKDVYAQFQDGAFNTTVVHQQIILDTVPPAPPVVTSPVDTYTQSTARPDIVGTADPDVTSVAVYDWNSFMGNVTPVGGVWTLPGSGNLPEGLFRFRASAADAAGNYSAYSQYVTYLVDFTPPVVTPPTDITVAAVDASGTPKTDAAIMTFLSGASATDNVSASGLVTNDAPALFPLGPTTVTFTAVDDTGNQGTATAVVTVTDQTPPVVTPPADVVAEATGPTTAVTLGTATVVDNVDVGLTASPDNPGPFAVGVHTVTWSATDGGGNTGSATQSVEVTDFTPPLITLNGTPVVTISEGSPYTDAGATAWDLVDGDRTASMLVNNPVDPALPGFYVILYTVPDSRGNLGIASRVVIVQAASVAAPVAASSGGCALNTANGFDPLLPVLTILAFGYLYRRRRLK